MGTNKSRVPDIQTYTVEGIGLQFALIKHASMSVLSTSVDHPSPNLLCLNIALFSLIPLLRSPLLLWSPSANAPLPYWRCFLVLHHLKVLTQVLAPCPSLLSAISECLPTSNMVNTPPHLFLSLLPTAEKLTFTLFPSHSFIWVGLALQHLWGWAKH